MLLFYWSIVLDDYWSKKIYRSWSFDPVQHSSLDDLVSFSKIYFNFLCFIGDEILCVYFKQCIGSLLRGGSWVLRLMSAPAFLGFLPTTNIRHCIHLPPPPNTPNCSILCLIPMPIQYTPTAQSLFWSSALYLNYIPPLLVSNFPISPQRTCSALISVLMMQNSTWIIRAT